VTRFAKRPNNKLDEKVLACPAKTGGRLNNTNGPLWTKERCNGSDEALVLDGMASIGVGVDLSARTQNVGEFAFVEVDAIVYE
jgi:hypothetical protein